MQNVNRKNKYNENTQKRKNEKSKNHENADRRIAEMQQPEIEKIAKLKTANSDSEFLFCTAKTFLKKNFLEFFCCRRLKIFRHMTLHISDCVQYSKSKL
jgi:nitrous oxide reductase